ncbi:MAG: type II secretion system protein [Pirellulaceae bacterium]|nr:prepilin-type N-terminal cleavage/methylation domain-containing protein [Planctomycetales bacterium]
MTGKRTQTRHGFTLVELLVVIVIIAILASLVVVGVSRAQVAARNAAIKMEISEIAKALEAYKNDMGEYPPDFAYDPTVITDPASVILFKRQQINQHLSRKFRNRRPDPMAAPPTAMLVQLDYLSDTQVAQLNPQTALYFWLRGFSPDPRKPITGAGNRTPIFQFDQARLTESATTTGNTDFPPYPPQYGQTPIGLVYYRAKRGPTIDKTVALGASATYGDATAWANAQITAGQKAVIPYISDLMNSVYVQDESYQIISAGLNSEFGVGGASYPSGVYPANHPITTVQGQPLSVNERDNITNFLKGASLEKDVP